MGFWLPLSPGVLVGLGWGACSVGVGVNVGSGVADGVAGTGVKVARRVAVGQGVSVGTTVTAAMGVTVGDVRTRPHPATVLTTKISDTRVAAQTFLSFCPRLTRTCNRPLR